MSVLKKMKIEILNSEEYHSLKDDGYGSGDGDG